MTKDDNAIKELSEARRQYREAQSALAVATTRLNRAEQACRIRRTDWHYDSQGYCDNPGRGY